MYEGDHVAVEYNGAGTMLRRYMWGPGADEPILQDEGGALNCTGTRFLHADHQGSIIATANCAGVRQTVNSYDEYGIPASTNWGRFQYTGQAWIPDLGVYYYKARIYSPTLGRFFQTDPIGYDDQVNLYAYVGNDPVNEADPSGMCPQCVGAVIGAITGAGLDYGVQVLGNLSEGKDLGDSLTDVDGGSLIISATGGAVAGATGVGTGALLGKVLKAEHAAVRAERAIARAREGIGSAQRAMRLAAQAGRAQRAAASSTSTVRRALVGAAAIKAGQQVAKKAEPKKDDQSVKSSDNKPQASENRSSQLCTTTGSLIAKPC